MNQNTYIPEPPVAKWLFSSSTTAWFWLIVRVYVGYQWFNAGRDKLGSAAWTGKKAGAGLHGFVQGALSKTTGAHPSVQGWYAGFLSNVVLPHTALFSWMVALGETAVGIALILGLFTGIAAFFGGFMNANYLLAGAVSTNPVLFILATWLVLAWRNAGWWGLDRWLLPALGTPWKPGNVFSSEERPEAAN